MIIIVPQLTRIVHAALPHIPNLVHLTHPDQVESLLVPTSPSDHTKPRILMIVGAIPSFAPITREERMVYTTVSSILTIPYDRGVEVEGGDGGELPMPVKRLFLEMPYKPRITPMVGRNSLIRLQLSTLPRQPHSVPGFTLSIFVLFSYSFALFPSFDRSSK